MKKDKGVEKGFELGVCFRVSVLVDVIQIVKRFFVHFKIFIIVYINNFKFYIGFL